MTDREYVKNKYPDFSEDEVTYYMNQAEIYGGVKNMTKSQEKGAETRARKNAAGISTSLDDMNEINERNRVGSEEYNKANEKSNNEKLQEKVKEDLSDLTSKAESSITSVNSEAENSGNEKIKNLKNTYDYSNIEKENKNIIKAGEKENDAMISEALADGDLDPNTLSGNQVEKNLLKMTDVAGRPIFTQNKDGSYTVAQDLTKKEFLEAVGGKKSNTTKNILTSLSAGLVLLGIPVPNLGKIYTNYTGENYDELYDEYKTQQSLLREGLNNQLSEGFGIVVKGAASRDDDINKASDKDYQKADDANRSKEYGWDLKKMEAEGAISANQSVKLEKLMKDLDKEQQTFIYDLQSRMEPAKHAEMLKLLSNFSSEELKQFSRRMKEYDPNNRLTKEDLTRLALQAASNIVGEAAGAASKLIGSDKNIKSFISGSRLFSRKGV